MRVSHTRAGGASLLLAALALAGCAERPGPRISIRPVPYAPEATSTPQAEPTAQAQSTPAPPQPAATPSAPVTPLPTDQSVRSRSVLHDLCHREGSGDIFEESRRKLAETFCGATLWLDSLFGGTPDVANARSVSGRVELTEIHTDFRGMENQARIHLNYALPNLQHRVRLFLGRADEQYVTDREVPFAVRAQQFGLLGDEDWLAGLGYSPPGKISKHLDFSVGARVRTAPQVFVQARYRKNWFVGEHEVWRFRETWFYDNRNRLGATTSVDYEHVLRPDLLFRWWNVGTMTQRADGLDWRNSLLLYYNLRGGRAMAGEIFLRGSTGAPVLIREYGPQLIYRQPLGRDYLYGDAILGYTWPRDRPEQARQGSAEIGIGLELQFGDNPY